MKKRKKKLLIGFSLLFVFIIAVILVLNLAAFIDMKIGVHTLTIVKNNGKSIIAAINENNNSFRSNLENVILKDSNFNEIDKNNVKVGDYIYLYIKQGDYYFCDNTTYYCKVSSIDDKKISVETPGWHFYSFNVDGVKIKDINGNKITSNDLKIGDTIKIININPEYTYDIAMVYEGFPASSISDVKSIRVIDTDEDVSAVLENRNMSALKKAIVAEVNKDNIYVVDSENQNLLYQVSFAKEGNIGFKVGQEVAIYFNGKESVTTKNGIIGLENVGKIEIINNNTNYLIPEDILKKFYTTFDNVDVNVENITNTGITFTITDKNDIKYNLNNNCALFRNVAEKPSNEPIIGEDGSMTIPAYEGDKWQELSKISDDIENKVNIENIDENTKRYTYDWSKIYGTLKSGEYKFVLGNIEIESNYLVIRNNIENISVEFELDDNGKISDVEIEKNIL